MPLAATVANSARPAPPSTGSGIAATIAPTFGNRPSTTRITPLAATTNRLLMPVMRHQSDVLGERAGRRRS